MCGWVQVESKCGHMSILWFGQSVQLGLGNVISHNMFFWWFSIYDILDVLEILSMSNLCIRYA